MNFRIAFRRTRFACSTFHVLMILLAATWTGCERRDTHDHDHDHGHEHHGHGDHGDEHEEAEMSRGPHGGRLLEDGDFSLEIAIYEAGVPPEFRVYASSGGQAVNPSGLKLDIELRRLGGRTDKFTFREGDGFLVGDQVVYEPHSFTAVVTVMHAGSRHHWEYDSPEARTVIPAEAAERSGIQVEAVGSARILSSVILPGEVRFNEERIAAVPARFEGLVVEVRKSVGDPVEAGEVIAVIDSRALADARADYIDAVHRLELAQAIFVREERLREKKIGVEQDYLTARHDMEEGEIRKQTARQKLLTLGIRSAELEQLAKEPDGKVVTFQVRQPFAEGALSRFNLTAPLAGSIVARDVAKGQTVHADDVLFRVADLQTVWIDLAMFSGQSAGVAVGQDVTVQMGDLKEPGKIIYLSPFVAEPSRAVTARVLLPNPKGIWRPGQFVDGTVRLDEVSVPVAVRPAALQSFRDWQVVFLNEGDAFEPVVVQTGRSDGVWVEITAGLKPGQKYVAAGSYVVKADILKSSAAHDHDH